MITEADLILSTTDLPEGRGKRAHELLGTAIALTDHLISLKVSSAADLGAKGGKATAKRGAEYYAKIGSLRKNRKGGRRRKKT